MGLVGVSLAAIVRDEMVNPAGGIVDFLDCTVPYVEEAVILDTGSADGTREALEEAQSRYPHLRVFDHVFNGYASSRNMSLKHVRTPYALVLDADERIRPEGYLRLAELMEGRMMQYDLRFINVTHRASLFTGKVRPMEGRGWGHNPRLFRTDGNPRFVDEVWEFLFHEGIDCDSYPSSLRMETDVSIFHYVGTMAGREMKDKSWYSHFRPGQDFSLVPSPSQIDGFNEWKQPPAHEPSLLRRLRDLLY
jgi:glycosyltransferase involved in cell wall biosynthesis